MRSFRPEELRQFWDFARTSWQFRLIALTGIIAVLFFNYFYHYRFKVFVSKGKQTLSYLYLIIISLNVLYYWFSWDQRTTLSVKGGATTNATIDATTNATTTANANAAANAVPSFAKPTLEQLSQIYLQRHARNVSSLSKKIVASNQEWKCGICRSTLDYCYEVDHVKALYQGGTNDLDNLMALCPNCHRKKTVQDRVGGGGHAYGSYRYVAANPHNPNASGD